MFGVEWSSKFSKTADYAKAAGEPDRKPVFVTGLEASALTVAFNGVGSISSPPFKL